MMEYRIYKESLELATGHQLIMMPYDMDILDVQMQGDALVFWRAGHPNEEKTGFIIKICFTGDKFPVGQYLKTIQHNGLVWHVFIERR